MRRNPPKSQGHSPLSLLFTPEVAVLAFAAFTFALDQNMSSPNLSDMAASFGLSPGERDARLGGLCMFAYFVVGGIFSLVVGGVQDERRMTQMLRLLALLYGISNFYVSLLVPNTRSGFFAFLLSRVCSGAAFGGALPLIFAMAGRATSDEARTLVSGLIGTAVSAGAAVGQVLNGLLPGWRVGYFVCAALAAAVAAAPAALAAVPASAAAPLGAAAPYGGGNLWRQPSAAAAAAAAGGGAEDWSLRLDFSAYRGLFKVQTNRIVFVQSVFGNIAWSVVAVFLADFIHAELGFAKSTATLAITVFGLGGLLGNIYGSKYGQHLFNTNNKITLVHLLSVPGIVGTLPMLILIGGKPSGFFTLVSLLLLASVAAVPGPNLKGLLLVANAQEHRAAVFSAFQLVEMLGKGAGPSLVSLLAIATGSRSFAMLFCILGWAIAGLLSLELTKFIERETSQQHDVVFAAFFDIYDLPNFAADDFKAGKLV